jgi:tRNA-specific 2-thiouridylase
LEHQDGSFGLVAGKDPNKDQSYFLCQLNQEQLAKALFPIGELLKPEVRNIAEHIGLHTADKKDSQGLCFVGKISLPQFLQQQLEPKKGPVIEIPADLEQFKNYQSLEVSADNVEQLAKPFTYNEELGTEVAQHQGAHYYTIGQRKGLHIGGRPSPSFVIGIDVVKNVVYSGQMDSHPGLNRWALRIATNDVHFVSSRYKLDDLNGMNCDARIRYRQPLQKASLHLRDNGLYVLFDNIQRGITPGQFAAFYLNEELIASGIISN